MFSRPRRRSAESPGAGILVCAVVGAGVTAERLTGDVALALRGRMPWTELPAYVAAQVAGGVMGAMLAHAMFELPVIQASATIRTGVPHRLAEVVATIGLVGAILAALRFRPLAVAWTVGLYITAACWFTASASFANPAVAIARGFSDTFSGIRPGDVPGFVLAELAGAALVAFVFGWLLHEAQDLEREPQA